MKSGVKACILALAVAAGASRPCASDPAGNLVAAGTDASTTAAVPAAAPTPLSTAVPAAEPTAAAAAAETQSVDADLVAGPVDLSLGAEARLSLPDGWRWVPKDRLQSYFGGDGRKAGAWDLGLALSPGQPLFEFRVQFEPMGAVAEPAGPLDSTGLLAKVQAAADAANQERRAQGGLEVKIPGWSQEPVYDTATKRLVWSERRESGAEERCGWHARLLGRAGVLKIDAEGPQDLMQLQVPLLQALFKGLSLGEGRGLADRSAPDKAAPVDLAGLLLDGTLGRGSLHAVAPEEEPLSPAAAGGMALAGTLLLAWAAVAGWRGLRRRRHMQDLVAAELERLGKLEKELGGSADDVQEVHEDGSDAAAPKGDHT